MTAPLFDYSPDPDLRRIAAALEGLLALARAWQPAAAPAAAPDPVPTPSAVAVAVAPAADPGDEDDADADDYTKRIRWAKYDPRSHELARLRTNAKHRAATAKTPDAKAAARAEGQRAHTESNRRHKIFRHWHKTGAIVIADGKMYRVNPDGSRDAWQSSFLVTK